MALSDPRGCSLRVTARLGGVLLALCALAGCPVRPVPMPTVVPLPCAKAECGAGTCADDGGRRDAVCTCAPGEMRTEPHRCVKPERASVKTPASPTQPRCTAPEHCADPAQGKRVCARLDGACRSLKPAMCGIVPDSSRGVKGHRAVGDMCVRTGASSGVSRQPGCGAITAQDRCAEGLACVATGPQDSSYLCGYPQQRGGVCRQLCDLCADQPACPAGQGCFLVGNGITQPYQGVCMTTGYVPDGARCGDAVCAPGTTCLLGGTLGGVATGTCVRMCPIDPKATPAQRAEVARRVCGVGFACAPRIKRFPQVGHCVRASEAAP